MWWFICFVIASNLIFLLLLSEIRQEVIDYMLRRDTGDDT